ncbi:hypothetical protein BDQ94DRAFT_155013 [Aspergillus welwitschiae]|uniref:Uncharacterized protein n=1 Tax=Aspergillus welwitschiae TaxID=1341132 RepID=A0A3F3PIG5_9EURO|nr:hypothetical protein BDQ94DRAFT_155013 [Aspergillus welwitschiae]RDH26744.1 hypothetical protein BDQ94DRAFT_155013 [Aspergillus welwitschiae]
MSSQQTFPSVDIIWQTNADFWILCPYYKEIHLHTFLSHESGLCILHCDFEGPSYQYNFPFAYEVGNIRARFANVNTVSYSEEDPDETASLSNTVSNMGILNIKIASTIPRRRSLLRDEVPFETRRVLLA